MRGVIGRPFPAYDNARYGAIRVLTSSCTVDGETPRTSVWPVFTLACAELARVLPTACPELRVPVTSRRMLDVTGEHVFVYDSTPCP